MTQHISSFASVVSAVSSETLEVIYCELLTHTEVKNYCFDVEKGEIYK